MIRKSVIKKMGLLLAIVISVALLSNPQSASAENKPIFLYAAYNQTSVSYSDYFVVVSQLGEMLEEEIGRKVLVKVPKGELVSSNEQVINALRKGKADIAWLDTFAYLVAHESANVEIIANSVRAGQSTYQSQFLKNYRTNFDELSDLNGVNLCWADPSSISGYIVPSLMLKTEDVIEGPDSRFVGSHQEVVRSIYDNECEAGATFVEAREQLAGLPDDVFDIVQRIDDEVSPPIPNDGFSVVESVPADLQVAIATALVEISQDEAGAMLLQNLGIQNFVQVNHSIFSGLENLIANAGMTPQVVWDTYFHSR